MEELYDRRYISSAVFSNGATRTSDLYFIECVKNRLVKDQKQLIKCNDKMALLSKIWPHRQPFPIYPATSAAYPGFINTVLPLP